MEKKTRSPFEGWPRTVEDTDRDGQPRITVWLDGLTPLCVKIADRVAMGCAVATACIIPYGLYKIGENALWQLEPPQFWLLGGMLAAPAITYFGVRSGMWRGRPGRFVTVCATIATCVLPYEIYKIVQSGQLQLDYAQLGVAGAMLAAPPVIYVAVKYGLYRAFRNMVRVVFTPTRFVIKGLFGEKRFDRDQPHSFAVHLHKKAKREEEMLSYRDRTSPRRRWQGARKRYYARSCHLSFQYFDQRNDIRTIYGMTESQTCLTRLNACNQMMDRYKLQGPTQALSPENDWPEQSGDLQAV